MIRFTLHFSHNSALDLHFCCSVLPQFSLSARYSTSRNLREHTHSHGQLYLHFSHNSALDLHFCCSVLPQSSIFYIQTSEKPYALPWSGLPCISPTILPSIFISAPQFSLSARYSTSRNLREYTHSHSQLYLHFPYNSALDPHPSCSVWKSVLVYN
jgi:hypothetical protein